MSRYIPTRKRQYILGMAEIPNSVSIYFHRNNLMKIKKALGSKCTYVGHGRIEKTELRPKVNAEGNEDPRMLERVKGEPVHYVVAKFGDAKPITAALNGTPNDIKAEYYQQLKNDLTDAARKRGIL